MAQATCPERTCPQGPRAGLPLARVCRWVKGGGGLFSWSLVRTASDSDRSCLWEGCCTPSPITPTYPCPPAPTPGQARSPAFSSLSKGCISGPTHVMWKQGHLEEGDSRLPSSYQLGQGNPTGHSPNPGPEKKWKQKPLCNALPVCTSGPGRGVCDTAQLPVRASLLLHQTRSWEGQASQIQATRPAS